MRFRHCGHSHSGAPAPEPSKTHGNYFSSVRTANLRRRHVQATRGHAGHSCCLCSHLSLGKFLEPGWGVRDGEVRGQSLTSSSTSASSTGALGRARRAGCGFFPGRRPGLAAGVTTFCLARSALRGLTERRRRRREDLDRNTGSGGRGRRGGGNGRTGTGMAGAWRHQRDRHQREVVASHAGRWCLLH